MVFHLLSNNNKRRYIMSIQDFDGLNDNEIDIEDGSEIGKVVVDKSTPTIDSLIGQYKKGFLKVPEFQRKFVWTIEQSSKFIESLMLGLPIPSLMFYEDAESSQLIVDGQQRMKSILFFVGAMHDDLSREEQNRLNFKLKGLSKDSPYYNKSYNDFSENEKKVFRYKRKLDVNLITLSDPNNLTAVYYIFERLNTGGTPLTAQEIRNCIYDGVFNKFINELNTYENWRKFFTNKTALSHQRDTELILRFFALNDREALYKRPMKEFLSQYMADPQIRNMKQNELDKKGKLFKQVVDSIYENFGSTPFHIKNGLNSSVCDAIMVAFSRNLDRIPSDITERFHELCINNEEFYSYVGKNSNDPNCVHNRIEMAEDVLFKPEIKNTGKIIKLYQLPVSAGTGNWVDGDIIPYINFISNNKDADFAVKVSGDSMEPTIPDGSILTIKNQRHITSGKIGIFTVNGEIFCKQYFKTNRIFLISKNKKYKKIQIKENDDFYINGIVLEVFPPIKQEDSL